MADFRSAVRYSAALYVTSDEAEISYCLRVAAPAPIPAIRGEIDMAELFRQFAGDATASYILNMAADWRPMTPDEIAEYEAHHA